MMAAVAPSSVYSKEKETSPRKKKVQISFAQSSFKANNQNGPTSTNNNNNHVAEDIQFLYTQLQKVKADNERLAERNDLLENQLSDILMRFKESSSRRKIEEQTFRKVLKSEKLSFDKKLAQKVLKLKEREKILNAWIKAVTDNELDKKYAFLNDILVKSKGLLAPKKKKDSGTKSPGKAKDKKKSHPPHQGDGVGEDYGNEEDAEDVDGDMSLTGEEDNNDKKRDSDYIDTDISDYPGFESDANSNSKGRADTKKPFRSKEKIDEAASEVDSVGSHMKLGSMLESKEVGATKSYDETDASPGPGKDVSLNESLMNDLMFDSDEGSLAEMDDFLTHSSTVQSELNLINRLLEGVVLPSSAKGRPQRTAGQGRPISSTAKASETMERVVYAPQSAKKDSPNKELSYQQIIDDIIHPVGNNALEGGSIASLKFKQQASLVSSVNSSPESSLLSQTFGSSLALSTTSNLVPPLPIRGRLSSKSSSRPENSTPQSMQPAADTPSKPTTAMKIREIDFVLQSNQETGNSPRLVPASRESDLYSEDFDISRNSSSQQPQKGEEDFLGGPAFNRNNIRESIQQIEKNIEMLKLGGELDDADVFNVDFD